jgi:hypothetical protein
MSSDFTPSPVQQSQYVQPSDGDDKPVASVTPFLQGLADGAKAGPLVPFNWLAPVATPDAMKRGWFSVLEQAWYAVGDNSADALDVSYTDGRTWKSLTGSLGSSLTLLDIAFDLAGNGVAIASATGDIYTGASSAWGTSTWTHRASALPSSPSDGRITYDAVHSKFVAVWRNGSSGIVIATSPTGTTWTSQTLPASWSGYTGNAAVPVIYYADGTLIAALIDLVGSPNAVRIIRSTDGGTTWTDVDDQNIVVAGTPNEVSIAYEPNYAVWFVSASSSSGTQMVQSQDDGVTWIPVAPLNPGPQFSLLEIICLCGVLIGLNTDGRIFFSSNLGTNWNLATAHKGSSGAPTGIRLGDGRLMVWNRADSVAIPSLRHGPTGVEVI